MEESMRLWLAQTLPLVMQHARRMRAHLTLCREITRQCTWMSPQISSVFVDTLLACKARVRATHATLASSKLQGRDAAAAMCLRVQVLLLDAEILANTCADLHCAFARIRSARRLPEEKYVESSVFGALSASAAAAISRIRAATAQAGAGACTSAAWRRSVLAAVCRRLEQGHVASQRVFASAKPRELVFVATYLATQRMQWLGGMLANVEVLCSREI